MADRRMLVDHLARTEQHVADGERLIAQERMRIDQMLASGRDVTESQRLLARLEQSQQIYMDHRARIQKELADNPA
jgi:hypothetical protein